RSSTRWRRDAIAGEGGTTGRERGVGRARRAHGRPVTRGRLHALPADRRLERGFSESRGPAVDDLPGEERGLLAAHECNALVRSAPGGFRGPGYARAEGRRRAVRYAPRGPA